MGCGGDCSGDGRSCLIEGEQCDDANNVNGDGCDDGRQFEQCGNGLLGPGEECDDGNPTPCDGCTGCLVDVYGDRRDHLIDGEQCGAVNNVNGDGCDAGCQFEQCGNGILDPGEECDDGNTTPCDGCTGCRVDFCGDGRRCLTGGEQCDDGNNVNGDVSETASRRE